MPVRGRRADRAARALGGLGPADPRLDHIPAGAAFAALSLGFLGEDDTVSLYETGPWTRLTTQRGHVLVKRRAWTLAR